MLTCYIDDIEDTDFNLKSVFPEVYVDSHSRSDCIKALKCFEIGCKALYFMIHYPLQEYVISVIEDLGEYAEIFFEDWDFESENLRGFVQLAIHNPEQFLKEMSFVDFDQYIKVMPIDVAEEYQAFRERNKPQAQQIEYLGNQH